MAEWIKMPLDIRW